MTVQAEELEKKLEGLKQQSEALKKQVEEIDGLCQQMGLQLTVMHRALIRCQARCHVLAEPPTGWRAVLAALKGLLPSREKKKKEEVSNNALALVDLLPPPRTNPRDNG